MLLASLQRIQFPVRSYSGVNRPQVVGNLFVSKHIHRRLCRRSAVRDERVLLAVRLREQHDREQALHAQLLIQHLADRLRLDVAAVIYVGVVQQVHDGVA